MMTHDDIMNTASAYSDVNAAGYICFCEDDLINFARAMEQASRRAAIVEAIAGIEAYQVPVGNSAAGEMACEWTMDALKEVRDAILALSKTAGES